jgi:sugar phosphate isomerase/epimerase
MAEDGGVILGHENCNGFGGEGPEQSLEMLAAVNSPAFKLIFDSGNNALHDNDQNATWNFYNKVKEHIVHVHLKAAKPGPEGKLITCYPDEDPTQLKVLSDLKKRGYDGWLSIEPHMAAAIHAGKQVNDAKAAADIYVEYARRAVALVAKA